MLDLAVAMPNPANSEDNLIKFTQVEAGLEDIANAASAAANSASDTRAKIAYYRIAATADWQRGDDRAFTNARQGSDSCNQGDNLKLVPRDCAILFAIPYLLRNDQLVATLQNAERDAGKPGFVAKYRQPANDLIASYNGIGKVMASTAAVVSPEMNGLMASQRQKIKSNVETIVNLLVGRAVEAEQMEALAICGNLMRDAMDIKPVQCQPLAQ
jgi:hypothetical protein